MIRLMKRTQQQEPQKARHCPVPTLPYITIDLSFIPAEMMTPELQALHTAEFINPCLADGEATMKRLGGGLDAVKRYKAAVNTFYEFDFTFRKFALDQFLAENNTLAAQCFLYLISNIHIDTSEKSHLGKIYDTLFN